MLTQLKHIAVITANYPSNVHPNRGVFVRELVNALVKQEVRCTVIHPWKLHEWFRERRHDGGPENVIEGVQVFRPLTLSVSNRRLALLNTFALTHADFKRAVWRCLQCLPNLPDALYGHFLYSGGATAVWAARRLGRPSFVAVGESLLPQERMFWTLQNVNLVAARKLFATAAGFLAVSDLVRRELVAQLAIPGRKLGVFPNGIDRELFHPRERQAMRQKHGLPQHQFLAAFVGGFSERKGVDRVSNAIRAVRQTGGIFIGDGPLQPRGDHVVFRGRVPHHQVAELLCAADVFVLPSRAEGCANAILEAMACGIPVVVSARPFNAVLCDEDSGLMVEPDSVAAIRDALVVLQNDPGLRQRLGNAAVRRAANFDIQARAKRILDWMQEKMDARLAAITAIPSDAPVATAETI